MCAKYVCSFVARECLSHRVKMNFNFTLPLDKTIERPPPIPQPAFLLPPLAPSAAARDIRSRRDWERDAKKWVPTRRYASPWCLPRILRPLTHDSLPPLLIYFASSFGHIRKRDKNFILMSSSFCCCWGSVFIFYFIFFLPFWWCC